MRNLLCEAREGRVPEPLATRPTLRPDLSPVWQGWWQLHKRRGRDMGEPLRIAGGEVDSLLDRLRIVDPEARADWHDWIEAMDDGFFTVLAERAERRRSANPVPRAQRREA